MAPQLLLRHIGASPGSASSLDYVILMLTDPDPQLMLEAINQTMPFGKYAGRKLLQLPEPYLVWFARKGFPAGKLGQQLALVHEIKVNGLEAMMQPLLET